MKVAIRADASVAIGTGHLRRCLALARELEARGLEVRFLWRDLGLDVQSMIANAGFTSIRMRRPGEDFQPGAGAPPHAHWARVSWQTDVADTLEHLGGFRPEVLIIDHYAFDSSWHQAVRGQLAARLVALDDLGDRPLDVDIIVDHNFSDDHLSKHAISQRFSPAILGGPEFALLSAPYRTRGEFKVWDHVDSVGVFLGGSDPDNQTAAALRALRAGFGSGVRIELATTRANPHLDLLRAMAEADGDCAVLVDLPDLAGFFGRHDLQIGAGGGATWERCCVGAPTVAIAFADNHRPVLDPLDAVGVLAFSRQGNSDEAALAADARALARNPARRRDMSARARRLVDGLGAVRVGDAIRALADR